MLIQAIWKCHLCNILPRQWHGACVAKLILHCSLEINFHPMICFSLAKGQLHKIHFACGMGMSKNEKRLLDFSFVPNCQLFHLAMSLRQEQRSSSWLPMAEGKPFKGETILNRRWYHFQFYIQFKSGWLRHWVVVDHKLLFLCFSRKNAKLEIAFCTCKCAQIFRESHFKHAMAPRHVKVNALLAENASEMLAWQLAGTEAITLFFLTCFSKCTSWHEWC